MPNLPAVRAQAFKKIPISSTASLHFTDPWRALVVDYLSRFVNVVRTMKSRVVVNHVLSYDVIYFLYTALLSGSRWIRNPINHSSTTMSVSPRCLNAHVFNHTRFSESN